jgi:hypothetical protein
VYICEMPRKRQDDQDEELARRMADSWTGLPHGSGQFARDRRAREIRNQVCQLRHRPEYAKNVSGDQEQCTLGILSAIVASIREQTGAHRGGLAAILNVHTTRISAMIDPSKKRWPASKGQLRQALLNATLWMFLGRNWQEIAARYAVDHRRSWTLKRDFPRLVADPEERSLFWTVRFAEDIAGYFFPSSGDFQTEIAQPYFDLARRNWGAPFDREELAAVIRWTRRHVKGAGKRAFIAFFCPTFDTADRLFDDELIRPRTAYAAREMPDRLKVNLFVPYGAKEAAKPGQKVELEKHFERDADAEAEFRRNWRGLAKDERSERKPKNVKIISGGSRHKDPMPALRGFLAFLFLAFEKTDSVEGAIRERLYVLRPYLTDRSFPFSLEATPDEIELFLAGAEPRYPEFQQLRHWLRTGDTTLPSKRHARKTRKSG